MKYEWRKIGMAEAWPWPGKMRHVIKGRIRPRHRPRLVAGFVNRPRPGPSLARRVIAKLVPSLAISPHIVKSN